MFDSLQNAQNRQHTQHTQHTDYRLFIADSLRDNSVLIADLWLNRLEDVLNESSQDIFPPDQYADHIPSMLREMGRILALHDENLVLVNSFLINKAEEYGSLRHQQRATVNQLTREYDLLSEVLEEFIVEQSSKYNHPTSSSECITLMTSVARIVRSILQTTIDSFVHRYMETINSQTEKILSFNAFVSHELKTPLQAAQLNMELLMEKKDLSDEDGKDLLTIHTSVQQASHLLKNIESITGNTDKTSRDNPVIQHIDIAALVRDVYRQLSDAATTRGVDIRITDDLDYLITDTAKLKLIFNNLLSNAVKYSDPEKKSRAVWVESTGEADDENVHLRVRDNGLGIDKHMQSAVFDLRVRAHEADDKRLGVTGYGMGLYLVSEAIKDLGGQIELNSTPGSGTEVHLSLPRAPMLGR